MIGGQARANLIGALPSMSFDHVEIIGHIDAYCGSTSFILLLDCRTRRNEDKFNRRIGKQEEGHGDSDNMFSHILSQ